MNINTFMGTIMGTATAMGTAMGIKGYGFRVLLLLASLVGCDSRHQVAPPSGAAKLALCPDFSITGKAPVEIKAQCGTLLVPENPKDPAGAKISLNILRLPAVSVVPEPDPLFIIAGGPGQSAVNLAESTFTLYSDIRKSRDIIFIDQRGTGKSNPLDCGFEDDEYTQLTEEQQIAQSAQRIALCAEKYQGHLAYYTTPYAVADLDAVRAHLGYNTINLWGGSYGSRVVLEYVRRYAEHARSGVVDGVAPTAMALPWHMEADALSALQKISVQCAQADACVNRYGNIMDKALQIAQQLRAKPLAVKVRHPNTQEPLAISLTAQNFSSALRFALYNRELATLLPKMISDTAAGDYQLLGAFIWRGKSRSDLSDINAALHFVVACAEDYPLYKTKNAQESNVFFDANLVQRYAEVCAKLPPSELPKEFWEPLRSSVPVFILSGAVDPVTPPHWGDSIAPGLSQSSHIIAPGGHHLIFQEGCVPQLIAAFIASASAQGLDTHCVERIQPAPLFIAPSSEQKPAPASSASSRAQE